MITPLLKESKNNLKVITVLTQVKHGESHYWGTIFPSDKMSLVFTMMKTQSGYNLKPMKGQGEVPQ